MKDPKTTAGQDPLLTEWSISPSRPAAIQAMHACLLAHHYDLIRYRSPVLLDDPADISNIKAENGGKVTIPAITPKSGKVFYWMYLNPGPDQELALVAQPHVLPFLLGLAYASGNDEAITRLSYMEGMLQR